MDFKATYRVWPGMYENFNQNSLERKLKQAFEDHPEEPIVYSKVQLTIPPVTKVAAMISHGLDREYIRGEIEKCRFLKNQNINFYLTQFGKEYFGLD